MDSVESNCQAQSSSTLELNGYQVIFRGFFLFFCGFSDASKSVIFCMYIFIQKHWPKKCLDSKAVSIFTVSSRKSICLSVNNAQYFGLIPQINLRLILNNKALCKPKQSIARKAKCLKKKFISLVLHSTLFPFKSCLFILHFCYIQASV